jgi:hypothetical protein
MRFLLFYVMLSFGLFLTSCSKDEDSNQPLTFRFLEFKKDVLAPNSNPSTIAVYGINFDSDLNNWQLVLVNQNNLTFPVSITSINNTSKGFRNGVVLQEIKINVPSLSIGDYSLTISNIITGQVHKDVFLVRGNTFNSIQYSNGSIYNLGSTTEDIIDYYYFQNVKNTIASILPTNNILNVHLKSKNSSLDYDLNYTVSENKVNFIIPNLVLPGKYYLSIEYDNLTSIYFEKDILVLEEQLPIANNINKNIFQEGETIIINGINFRYKVNSNLLPYDDLFSSYPNSSLFFKQASGSGEFIIFPFVSDPTFNLINSTGTTLNFKIPSQFFITSIQGKFFEGQVFVRSGPYFSAPFPIRINYL